jgi:hypothetical protein
MNLAMRNKLLSKLIEDLDMMGEGEEAESKADGKKPAKLEILSVEKGDPKIDDESEEALEEDQDELPAEGVEELKGDELEHDPVVEDDGESLDEDGLLPHERLRKLMKAKGM